MKCTCAGAADNAVVDVGAAVNCDLQTVVSIMMLCWLIIRVELKVKQKKSNITNTQKHDLLQPLKKKHQGWIRKEQKVLLSKSHHAMIYKCDDCKKKKAVKTVTHPDGHVAHICIFRSLHKHKRWISSVFNDNLVSYLPWGWKERKQRCVLVTLVKTKSWRI